jgi:RNA polymerase sigma factor (TIGR02999 family)
MEPSGTPTPPTQPDLTAALRRASSGSDEAVALLWSLTYEELRRMARGLARSESRHDDLQPTALVHDLWLRTFGADRPPAWDNRRHFFGSMARALQQHLIDLARQRAALKRGGNGQRRSLEVVEHELRDPDLALSEAAQRASAAIEALDREHPECAEVARLRFIVGLSLDETASITGVTTRTVSNRWRFAQCWIRSRLANIDGVAGP